MQVLATGVDDLKKMLTNVKTRGTWGEVQLGAMLEQFSRQSGVRMGGYGSGKRYEGKRRVEQSITLAMSVFNLIEES